MSISRPIVALTALVLVGPVGCDHDSFEGHDSDAEADDARREVAHPHALDHDALVQHVHSTDHRGVGHVDIAALSSAPWAKEMLEDGALEVDGELGSCADVLRDASAITFGVQEQAFEVYLQGSFDAAEANACAELIDAKVAAAPEHLDGKPTPEATLLADDVFVVFGGDLGPSRDRLQALLDADPSSGQPLWVVADTSDTGKKVDHVALWADPSGGLEAHAALVFADEAEATELYGQAMLGLTALRLSDEVGELASAVSLSSSGAVITADLSLDTAQMETLVAKGKAHARARAEVRDHHGSHGEGSGLEIHIEAE